MSKFKEGEVVGVKIQTELLPGDNWFFKAKCRHCELLYSDEMDWTNGKDFVVARAYEIPDVMPGTFYNLKNEAGELFYRISGDERKEPFVFCEHWLEKVEQYNYYV